MKLLPSLLLSFTAGVGTSGFYMLACDDDDTISTHVDVAMAIRFFETEDGVASIR